MTEDELNDLEYRSKHLCDQEARSRLDEHYEDELADAVLIVAIPLWLEGWRSTDSPYQKGRRKNNPSFWHWRRPPSLRSPRGTLFRGTQNAFLALCKDLLRCGRKVPDLH